MINQGYQPPLQLQVNKLCQPFLRQIQDAQIFHCRLDAKSKLYIFETISKIESGTKIWMMLSITVSFTDAQANLSFSSECFKMLLFSAHIYTKEGKSSTQCGAYLHIFNVYLPIVRAECPEDDYEFVKWSSQIIANLL